MIYNGFTAVAMFVAPIFFVTYSWLDGVVSMSMWFHSGDSLIACLLLRAVSRELDAKHLLLVRTALILQSVGTCQMAATAFLIMADDNHVLLMGKISIFSLLSDPLCIPCLGWILIAFLAALYLYRYCQELQRT